MSYSFRLILVVAETRECVCVCWYYCSVSSHCWHAGLPISRCQPLAAAAFLPQPAVPICLRTNSLSVLPILELFRARFMLKHWPVPWITVSVVTRSEVAVNQVATSHLWLIMWSHNTWHKSSSPSACPACFPAATRLISRAVYKAVQSTFPCPASVKMKERKVIPLQAWTGPWGSRRLSLPDF